jgi:nucleotide-binding universal stress UspA family protein
MFKRILAPLDGSLLSEAILPHAETIARAMDAEIILLYVNPGIAPEFSVPPLTPTLKVFQESEAEMKIYLKSVCTKLEKVGLRVTYLIHEGAIAETILKVAEIMQAELIVMSTHGRTGAQRLLLGSVTDGVVHDSPLPVMVIRPKF